jgi:tetrahydromethanopterin S-methyltransferase subunit B
MNILKNFWNTLMTKIGLMTAQVAAHFEAVVASDMRAVEEKASEVSDAVKAYVRDELGRFAKKVD